MGIPFIRPARRDDFDAIYALARQSGGGMTNLPADEKALRARIEISCKSFEKNAQDPGGEIYMLVLESDGRVMGTAAVFSAIGLDSGFVNYKINRTFHASKQLNKRIARRLLVPTHDFTGCAEVGSLFLSPDARGGGFGKLLARSRYLFIAQNRKMIADHVCAELRGWRAPDGSQPFWDAVGKRFFDMDFEEADVHNAANGNQFIADLMPRYPIYVVLLPEAARECLGKPHDTAIPAYKMLLSEGFEFDDYIDIFDAGPLVDVKVDNIKTVKKSRVLTAKIGAGPFGETMLMAAGERAAFRAVRDKAIITGETVEMSANAAAALNVAEGASIRCVAA
ncbi:MAG: arginine N-succinyltransferase [Parvularculaceae bacterium]